tara:strand:+ start:323 stop:883 length:561 start_codon:yes stop_codon:yes gene_type:complete
MRILLILVLALTVGCSKNISPMSLESADAPKWVIKGNDAFKDKKMFYGIGSASNFKNYSLQRSAADNRARNDIAKYLEFYTASLMKDYEASTAAESKVDIERHTEQVIKTVTSQTLTGVVIVDHWEHSARGELFSLARLDMEKFKENISKQDTLSKEVKEYVRENADELHEELIEEEEKLFDRRGE